MDYLFVRVVKARDLPAMDLSVSIDPFVEVRVGNCTVSTKKLENNPRPVWNEVFAFSRNQIKDSHIEVEVNDKDPFNYDEFVGRVKFELRKVPIRVPPDSPLAPTWYVLEDKDGNKTRGVLMLAVWIGTQADEAFPDAWHSDAAAPVDDESATTSYTESKVYDAPRLWIVRVNIIEAQNLVVAERNRFPDVYVRAQIGHQSLRTRQAPNRTLNPQWNEEMLFVTAEPFEDDLILSAVDRVGPDMDEVIGRVVIPLASIEKRADDRMIQSMWFPLEKPIDINQLRNENFSRLHVRLCLDGGYHVLGESEDFSSDLRPTAEQLWKPSIGVLELGILSAKGLHPMKTRDGKGTSDTFCVAKYGHKWVRTRTIFNSLIPEYNEQYTWEVYDPAAVLTVGVFDNCQLLGGKDNKDMENVNSLTPEFDEQDMKIGKVHIRLSTLETDRVYAHSYPLLVLHPSGVQHMGELHLAIRFSCTSLVNMMYVYSQPLLPKMHYISPLPEVQQGFLLYQAVDIVAARLSRADPPLRREVIEYMTDVDPHLWSLRKSKANFFRLMSVFSGLFAVKKWFGDVCMWKNPVTTVLVHVLVVMVVCFPELMLAVVFLYIFSVGIWNYRFRPRHPPHIDLKRSHANAVYPDELCEEFDTFPTSCAPDLLRMRYDRMRSVTGRLQKVVGDVAKQGERVQALVSWRDPRATAIFMIFCLVAALVLCMTTLEVIVVVSSFYMMRHPWFRHHWLPAVPMNLFRRLPSRTDSTLFWGVNQLRYDELMSQAQAWSDIQAALVGSSRGKLVG